jgi:hypothetical protein
VVTVEMISNALCVVGNPAISSGITMIVNPNVVVSVSASASPSGAICAGTSVTFTATPTYGGASPTYQWKINGTDILGQTTSTFTSTTLANNDVVTVEMTSNAACVTGSPATSTGITMTVNPNVTASVSVSAAPSGAICVGTSVTFTATPTNGGSTPTYQWKINGNNVSGQTASTFTTTTLANNDVVTVEMTSNALCVTGSPATSPAINMTVNPYLIPSVVIAASPSGQVNVGTSISFTATPTNGGTLPTYQWQVNGLNVLGANSSVFTTSTLQEDDVVTAIMTSSYICLTTTQATSNSIVMDLIYPFDTNIIPTQCGSTLGAINQFIYAVNIPSATGYRFKITDLVTNQVQILDRILRVFQLTQLGNYAFDRTYKIQVAARVSGVWRPFGNPCNVTTPIPITSLVICNGTLTLIDDAIYATNVPYCIGYRFRVTNTTNSVVEIIDRDIRDLRLTYLTNPQYNTTYSVQVAVRNTNGVYMPYGPSCNVTSPPVPTSELIASQCDSTLSLNTVIYATSFYGGTNYKFKVENTALGFSYIFVRPLPTFTLNQVPGLLQGQTYSVSVSVEVGTVYGPFGKICTITIPPAAKTTATISEFKVIAYPNPFSDSFMLDVNSLSNEKIQLKVYDMLGKLIDDRTIDFSDVTQINLGTSYPSGIYNFIVSQDLETKTLRIIKR